MEREGCLKKEAVFLPFIGRFFNTMEPAYREALADEVTRAVLLPVRYYDKDSEGRITAEHFDMAEYPDGYNLYDHNAYDLEACHPDEIYIQNPFDDTNPVFTVESRYMSEELRKYTEKLVYIPYFKLTDEVLSDERGRSTASYFIPTPAAVNADEIVLPTEGLRRTYIEILTGVTGEETREIWKNKMSVAEPREEPGRDKRDNIILFSINVSVLLEYEEAAIEKMREVLRIFEEAGDVKMLFSEDPEIERILPEANMVLYEAYCAMRKEYSASEAVMIRNGETVEEVIAKAKAFYGAPGKEMRLSTEAGLPVMQMNIW